MAIEINEKGLLDALNRAIKAEVERVVEEVANEAAEKARAAVREKVGAIACGLLGQYNLSRDGRDLLIRVRIEGDQK